MPAQPTLDMMVATKDPVDLDAVISALMPLGYQHIPDADILGDEVFGKGDPRTHLLHVVPSDGPVWNRMLRFRSALLASAELASEYASLKRRLAEQFPDDPLSYAKGKSEFIRGVLGELDDSTP